MIKIAKANVSFLKKELAEPLTLLLRASALGPESRMDLLTSVRQHWLSIWRCEKTRRGCVCNLVMKEISLCRLLGTFLGRSKEYGLFTPTERDIVNKRGPGYFDMTFTSKGRCYGRFTWCDSNCNLDLFVAINGLCGSYWSFPYNGVAFQWIQGIRHIFESLKHELGSISRSCLSYVPWWHCGSILISNTRDGRFKPFYCNDKYFVTELSEFNEIISGKLNCHCTMWTLTLNHVQRICWDKN